MTSWYVYGKYYPAWDINGKVLPLLQQADRSITSNTQPGTTMVVHYLLPSS